MKPNSMNTPHSNRLRLLMTLAVILLGTWGCAGITPARIAPKAPVPPLAKIDGSVRVMDVVGGDRKSCFGCTVRIKNEEFKEALILALRQSGLFNEVSSDRGDVCLYATIQSEQQTGFLPLTVRYVMTYKFTDAAGKTLSTASYSSEASASNFAGATRTVYAHERSAKENLKALIQGIDRERRKLGVNSPAATAEDGG